MANFHIIVGSVMGTAAEVADALEETLSDSGHNSEINQDYKAGDLSDKLEAITLLCCSTTGIGDLPESIRALHSELVNAPPMLSGHKYLVVGLGDSSYPDFAQGAKTLDEAMTDIGAHRIGEPCFLDAMETDEPEVDAQAWLKNWLTDHQSDLS